MIEPFKSSGEMRKKLNNWLPCWGNEISTLAIVYACEKLEEIADLLRKPAPVKRKPTAWQRFFSVGMKAGKSPKQIAKEWADRRQFEAVAESRPLRDTGGKNGGR